VSVTLDRPKVPAEYRGLARVFRDAVKRVDEVMDKALATIARPLAARLRRHHRLRHELVAVAVKTYRMTVPAAFRFCEIEVRPDRDAFEIPEHRATATWINSTTWNSDATEPSLAIPHCSLAMRPSRGMARSTLTQVWMPRGNRQHARSRPLVRAGTGWRDHDRPLADLAVALPLRGLRMRRRAAEQREHSIV
jgi:hypothetical protein